jgi:predicted dehydrogenase
MSTDSSTTAGAAIVGTGFMGRVHTEALRRIGVPVLGVVGSSPGRAAEQASAAGLPAPYGSLAEALDDDRVGVVHVCSPNHLHHEQSLAALRAGKHVVCEKPLAMTSAQAAELRDAAHASGLVHALCFIQRFYPLCQEIRARVASGAVGDVRLISGSYLQDWLVNDTDWNWRLDPELGGSLRVVGDIGSHWLDLAEYLSGRRIEAVVADLTTALPTRVRPPDGNVATFAPAPTTGGDSVAVHTEDVAGILLRFDGGARGVLTLSQISPGRKNRLSIELSGSVASLQWTAENPEQLWIGHRDAPNEVKWRDTGDYPAGHGQGYPDAFKALFGTVYRAVAAGGPPPTPDYPTFDDGVEQALIADAIAASARDGRWVTVQRPE